MNLEYYPARERVYLAPEGVPPSHPLSGEVGRAETGEEGGVGGIWLAGMLYSSHGICILSKTTEYLSSLRCPRQAPATSQLFAPMPSA